MECVIPIALPIAKVEEAEARRRGGRISVLVRRGGIPRDPEIAWRGQWGWGHAAGHPRSLRGFEKRHVRPSAVASLLEEFEGKDEGGR
jgi:hypothetical protein